jgi:metal-sulfur cluster biosynthetic enzyme
MTDRQSTHGHDCWDWGPKHYQCAVRRVEQLRAEVGEWKRVAAAQAELHDEAEARAERLAEELIEMNDRIEELKKRGMITSLARIPDAQNEGRAITAVQVTLLGRECFLPADIAEEVEQRLEAAEKVAEASRQLASMYERATGLPCPPQLRRALAAYDKEEGK